MQDDKQALLCDAIQSGALDRAYQLLETGIDPNQVGEKGNTALHEASKRGYTHLAALLLSKGADYTVRNVAEQTALVTDFTDITTIHRIRQEYQRMPVYPYDQKTQNQQVNDYVDQLNRDGLLKISGLIDSVQLSQLKKDFKTFISRVRIKRFLKFKGFTRYNEKEYWRANHRAYVTNDALQYSTELIKFCNNPVPIETVNHYLEKVAYIKRVYAMRYLPFKPMNTAQFEWHHDMEDRQLKILLLLTDIDEQDQYMNYVKGTHKVFHPYQGFLKHNYDLEYFKESINDFEIIKTTRKAGDLFLFDSNGMHRGVRSNGRVRDAYFIEFTAAKNKNNIWGSESANDLASAARKDRINTLHKLLNTTPKWKRARSQKPKKGPSWIESLENPQLWI